MKNKLLLLPLVLLLSSCELNQINSSTNSESNPISDSINSVESTTLESSSLQDSSAEEESSTLQDSSLEEESSSASEETTDKIIDVSEKEYYKSLVARENIVKSNRLENDETHDTKAIEIYQLNDTHGAYYDENEIVGISRVQTCIDKTTVDPYSVVKIANGDMLQGTAFSNMLLGEPGIEALNYMNFDAFVIGNHEFDWGIDNLSVYKDGNLLNGELECEFLGANILNGDNERPEWIKPYTVVNKGDVTVGIIGVIGDGLESSISKVALGKYHFTSTVEAVKKYSKILLEEEQVDVIIVGEHNHNEYGNQQMVDVARVDAIINGHDHWRVEEQVNRYDGLTVPVIESNTKNGSIGKITLNLDDNNLMTSWSMKHYYPEDYSEDPILKANMDVYYKVTGEYQNTVIGYNQGGMDKKTIGVSTCTYIAKKYGADVAMMNTGGVRASIASSEITNGMVYEALPFDNELYIATLKGSELKKICRSGYYYNDSGIGNGTNVSTSQIVLDKYYKVVCVDYVATQSYFSNFFNEEHNLIKTGDYIRDCAIENIKENYNNN